MAKTPARHRSFMRNRWLYYNISLKPTQHHGNRLRVVHDHSFSNSSCFSCKLMFIFLAFVFFGMRSLASRAELANGGSPGVVSPGRAPSEPAAAPDSFCSCVQVTFDIIRPAEAMSVIKKTFLSPSDDHFCIIEIIDGTGKYIDI